MLSNVKLKISKVATMIDMGLRGGARSLWEDDLLCDYTIRVEHREFRVHKVVLASVSEYFRVMFTGSMKESQTDNVELKELRAETFSKLLDLIYTGNEDIVTKNAAELLPCAVYLEIRSAIKECKQELLASLDGSNCLDVLSLVLTYGDPSDAEIVKNYMENNWYKVRGDCEPINRTYATVQCIAEIWKGLDWELFQVLKVWIDEDNNRERYTNDLMSHVRFSLMTPQEVAAVKKTSMYKQSRDAWQELVDKAATYLKLPMHNKVLEDSEQTTVRIEAEPVFFTENDNDTGSKTCAAFIKDIDIVWETHNVKGPKFSSALGGTVHVNNFLICYTELDKGQTDWYIFDARTLKWAEMARMSRPKADFALVHHNKHLYVLGGRTDTQALTKTVEQYDFRTNKWKSTRKPLPVPAAELRACVLDDAVYCCSGIVRDKGVLVRSQRMNRLDMLTKKWECRAPMLVSVDARSAICVMKISGEDVIVLARKDQVDTYNPNTDQWSVWKAATMHFTEVKWDSQSWIMAQGKTIYLCNIIEPYDASNHSATPEEWVNWVSGRGRRVCVRYTMIEEPNRLFRFITDDVPVPRQQDGKHEKMFGGLLALPYHKLN